MKRKTPSPLKPVRSPQIPVTVQMLNEMEGRLSHKIDSGLSAVRSEIHGVKAMVQGIKSELNGVKADIHGVKSELNGVKAGIHEVKSEFHGVKADIHGIKSELHRVALLVEEQNARNKFVLDGYTQLYDLIARKLGS